MRPNDGKHIAKGKGVHREVESEGSRAFVAPRLGSAIGRDESFWGRDSSPYAFCTLLSVSSRGISSVG